MEKPGFHIGSIRSTFKRKFIAGLLVSIPAVVTIAVLVGLFRFIDGLLSPVIEEITGRHLPGLGFVATIMIILLLGMISTNVVGRKVLMWLEKWILRMPILRTIYNPTKQLIDAFSPENRAAFKDFVIVEHPRTGVYSFGFLTSQCMLSSEVSQEGLYTVYIPTNHLYLGDIVLMKKEDVIHTDITIDEGIRLILSAGLTAPSTIEVKRP